MIQAVLNVLRSVRISLRIPEITLLEKLLLDSMLP